MVLGAVALSTGLLYVDEALAAERHASRWWLFGGNAEGARTLLSVIAGSLITVISVAFSVTMIAIQQASTQYTPRVLRNYTKDRGNQLVLGTYIATFTYALLVLREVRAAGEDGAGFVPTWSILGAMLLALASLGALIYFMHHVSESLQVSYLLGVIRHELDEQIPSMFPETLGEGARDPEAFARGVEREEASRGPDAVAVRSEQEGYLRRIDEAALATACDGLDLAVVPVQIGDRLQRDTLILRGWTRGGPAPDVAERVRGAFDVDGHRTTHQDVLFGFRQLVDIAVKALSPGINDPTTAEEAIAEIVGALSLLVRRGMPNPARRVDSRTRLLFKVPTFESIVEESVSQIRRAARTHLHVTLALLEGLQVVASRAGTEDRREPLRSQAAQILEALPGAGFTRDDEGRVRRAAAGVLVALGRGGAEGADAGARAPR
jgi:uncharacterized membrane protein